LGFFVHHVLGTKITLPEIQRPGGAPHVGHVALVFFLGVFTFTVHPPTDRRSVEPPPLREILLARMCAGCAIRARDISAPCAPETGLLVLALPWRPARPGGAPLIYLRNQ
jgi:hypothetical protein